LVDSNTILEQQTASIFRAGNASPALNMEAVVSFETLVTFYQTRLYRIVQDRNVVLIYQPTY
jgi:hypothetical protein